MDEAHRRGILHRDLKPQNILVDRQTDAPLVADFGLAKLVQTNDELTRAGDVMGSPPYMSPEQARDSSLVTTQSDVYALGATLYHALTGKPPFRADTVLDTLAKVVHEEPVPLRQINPAIDLDLETICLKCLQKEPRAAMPLPLPWRTICIVTSPDPPSRHARSGRWNAAGSGAAATRWWPR